MKTCIVACLLSVSACTMNSPDSSGPASVQKFQFRIHVVVTPEITSVLADGDPLPLVPDGMGRALVFQQGYVDYGEAQASSPISFTFMAGDEIRNMGESRPGACAKYCDAVQCPRTEDVVLESLDIPLSDFQPYQYDCMKCASATKFAEGCF